MDLADILKLIDRYLKETKTRFVGVDWSEATATVPWSGAGDAWTDVCRAMNAIASFDEVSRLFLICEGDYEVKHVPPVDQKEPRPRGVYTYAMWLPPADVAPCVACDRKGRSQDLCRCGCVDFEQTTMIVNMDPIKAMLCSIARKALTGSGSANAKFSPAFVHWCRPECPDSAYSFDWLVNVSFPSRPSLDFCLGINRMREFHDPRRMTWTPTWTPTSPSTPSPSHALIDAVFALIMNEYDPDERRDHRTRTETQKVWGPRSMPASKAC